jgi:superfamily II DNA or RNA helicase/tetratricopeptide (TPR) repeat protein
MKKKAAGDRPASPQADKPRKKRKRSDEYAALAGMAFLALDYQEALSWALKSLELDPGHAGMQFVALDCARILQDDETLLILLTGMYRDGALAAREGYLFLGRTALAQQEYALAEEVYMAILDDAASGKPRLKGRLTKAMLKEIEQGVRYAQLMLEKSPFWGTPAALPPKRRLAEAPTPVVPRVRKAKKPEAAQTIPPAQPAPASPPKKNPRAPDRSAPTGKKARETSPAGTPRRRATPTPPPRKKPVPERKAKARSDKVSPASPPEPLPELKVVYEIDPSPVVEAVAGQRRSDPEAVQLSLKAYRLSFRTSYDQLLCLPTLQDVRSLWYQEETARKVMKNFRGRAILADEVGLGKTIEAGLILKEYLMRGLVKTVLVLTPSSLVRQWQEELAGKFGLAFASTQDELFRQDPGRFWAEPFILASLQTVRSRRHFPAVTSRSYDLVVVDEAHHLKNRATQNWKLVNTLQKTFLLMLTATPVQNSLEELYNLVTLLRPGHLKTLKSFKAEFVTRGSPTDPRNREKLRELLKEVMVRNTRAVTQLRLPPRFALTLRLSPTPKEAEFYQRVSRLVTAQAAHPDTRGGDRLTWRRLLEAAGSSPAAALRLLARLQERHPDGLGGQISDLMTLGRSIRRSAKVQKVVELLKASPEQKLLFVNYLASLEYLEKALTEHRISHVVYQGSLTPAQKQAALQTFREGCPVLLATGTGGEGHNLQFCHVMLNYDLPWNPMEIEQRIGRLHRIGQEKEVQVYNFCTAGSLEDHILEVLDKKINMFELVVGEIDMILGRLQDEVEFGDLVYDIWVQNPGEDARRQAFEALAQRLRQARTSYEMSKELDEKLFQEDFGV